jgi:hypothetical protein
MAYGQTYENAPNIIGGAGGLGGFGEGGLLTGIILASLLGKNGNGLFGGNGGSNGDLDADAIAARVVSLQSSANILAAVEDAKNSGSLNALAITDAVKDGNYNAAIQSERNTNEILRQQTAFAVAATRENDVNTAAIIARINQNEVDMLKERLERERDDRRNRDTELIINNTNTNTNSLFQSQTQAQLQAQLDESRRRFDHRENEINIVNTNTNINAQAQAQAQAQAIRDLDRDHKWNQRFDALISQNAKVGQDIVNIGGLVAANQTSSPTNVNSKQS